MVFQPDVVASGRGRVGLTFMPSPEEKEIVDELDREVSRKGSLIALVACLALAGGMFVAATLDVLRPV